MGVKVRAIGLRFDFLSLASKNGFKKNNLILFQRISLLLWVEEKSKRKIENVIKEKKIQLDSCNSRNSNFYSLALNSHNLYTALLLTQSLSFGAPYKFAYLRIWIYHNQVKNYPNKCETYG